MGLFDKLFGGAKKTFTPSDKLMDEDQFWKIIKTTKDKARADYELQQKELATQLRKLSADDIILFNNRFRYFRGQANTWQLWAAIYIINGGCGDDSFGDFREWVIARGKDFYYATINDPQSLITLEPAEFGGEWEGLGYVPSTVFEDLTGEDLPYPKQENMETTGKQWDEEGDDLKNMFPKLYAKYKRN